MRYLVLLAADEAAMPQPGTADFDADMAAFDAFGEVAGPAIVAGEELADRSTCRTIRHTGGEVTITDGPFAESVEGIGGFFVLDAGDLDDAVELARLIPPVRYGSVEVRPMVEWSESDGSEGSGQASGAAGPRWLATIHGPETDVEVPGSPGWDEGAAEHGRFADAAGPALLASGAVYPTTSATTLRLRDGELLVTDGPYAESVEVVGGFYLLRGELDAVLELAARIPVVDRGGVQLQAIVDRDD